MDLEFPASNEDKIQRLFQDFQGPFFLNLKKASRSSYYTTHVQLKKQTSEIRN